MKNVLKSLLKKVLISLGSTAAAATDVAFHKKIFASGTTTLVISNEKMIDMKMVKSLKKYGLLIQSVSETLTMKQKNKKADFSAWFIRKSINTDRHN